MDKSQRAATLSLGIAVVLLLISAATLVGGGTPPSFYSDGIHTNNTAEHAKILERIERLQDRMAEIDRRASVNDLNDREALSVARQVERQDVKIAINSQRLDRIESFGLGVLIAAFGAAFGAGASAVFSYKTHKAVVLATNGKKPNGKVLIAED
jgi:hypothetical protein